MAPPNILLVTHASSLAATIESLFESDEKEVTVLTDVGAVEVRLKEDTYDVVVLHENAATLQTVDVSSFVDSKEVRIPCIWIAVEPTLDNALKAMHKGVFSYLPEPLSESNFEQHVRSAIAQTQLERLIVSTEERTMKWIEHQRRMKAATSNKGLFASDVVLHSFFESVFERVVDAYMDARQLLFILNQQNPTALQQQLRHDPVKKRLLQAIKKGVQVLWATRNQFKSKQIANLRKDFEGVLKEVDPDSSISLPD